MLLKYIHILILALLLIACSGSKEAVATQMQKDVANLVSQNRFYIESDVAYPTTSIGLQSLANSRLIPFGSSVNRFDLTGNTNYFKVLGDSLSVYLPYFGEQQMGGLGYNNRTNGIEFDGIPDKHTTDIGKKGSKILDYTFRNNMETYVVRIQIFGNGNCSIAINPSHRTSIRYKGYIKPIFKEEGVVSN